MQDGAFRLSRGVVRVTARAPGHNFSCEGEGATAELTFEGDRLVKLDASFPLARLKAPDPLGQHEMKKFLDLDRGPIAKASLVGPIAFQTSGAGDLAGDGTLELWVEGKKRAQARARFSGRPARGKVALDLTFTALGYTPPKLLILKVKDELQVEIEGTLEGP